MLKRNKCKKQLPWRECDNIQYTNVLGVTDVPEACDRVVQSFTKSIPLIKKPNLISSHYAMKHKSLVPYHNVMFDWKSMHCNKYNFLCKYINKPVLHEN